MRTFRRTLIAATVLLLALVAAQADPLITAWIGTPTATSKTGYFVLDFNDAGSVPQTYAFGWYYEGVQTDADFLAALQSALTGPNGFQQVGAASNFVTRLGYNGRTHFNDFAGTDSGDPNGFWNLWLGTDGLSWTSAQFGPRDVTLSDTPVFTLNPFTGTSELSGAPWHGWRWVRDFTTDTALAPRTPQVAGAADVPEPGTLGLLLAGVAGASGVALRRRTG